MDILYTILLSLHSVIRWLVVFFALLTVARALTGWFGKRPWADLDRKIIQAFTISMDSQVLIGLILYFFLSPITTAALRNFGGAMSNASVRYFAVEHIVMMLVATALVHVGGARVKKAESAQARYRNAAIWFGLAVLVTLFAIPWGR